MPGHAGARGDCLELVDDPAREEVDIVVAEGKACVAVPLHT